MIKNLIIKSNVLRRVKQTTDAADKRYSWNLIKCTKSINRFVPNIKV